MEPHLFDEAVDAQLSRLSADADAATAEAAQAPADTTELTLYRRIEDVKRRQRAQAVQARPARDALHSHRSAKGAFQKRRADTPTRTRRTSCTSPSCASSRTSASTCCPPWCACFARAVARSALRESSEHLTLALLLQDGGAPDFGPVNLLSLTERVHSAEALELVREHLGKALGGAPGAAPPMSAMLVRMSKLQAAQMYAWSVMFGYFLRRVESRFKLERALGGGALPRSQEESVAALEALFNAASAEEPAATSAAASADAVVPAKGSLKRYVESFDAEALGETARIVSVEGLALLDRQTSGLFGSLEALQRQMAEAVGNDARSEDEFKQRVHNAIASGAVETLTLPYTQQRRVVLEAVAFGAFLRDVESRVAAEPALLTPAGASGR
jgi:hypothetical protein